MVANNGEPIALTKDGGVLKTILSNGQEEQGQPAKGDSVWVHYVGTLKDSGEKFDSSRDRDEPFKFTLGKGEVIKGWDHGVASMCKGELAKLECSPDYAYGQGGSPPKIPPNATLIFEVELLRWEGEDISPDRDGSIQKSVITEGGEKYNFPVENAQVKVHAVGSYDGRVFYDQELDFILGEGSEHLLPEGVDRALRRINKGEKCRLILKGSRYTYGANPPSDFNLPSNAQLTFTLFLKDFEKVKASWEMSEMEKLENAQQLKDRGTEFLKQGKLSLAMNKYNGIILLLEHATKPSTAELAKDYENMLVAGWLNCALINLKTNDNSECVKNCDKVLEKAPDNVKALYRKAQALQNRKEYEEALELYKKVTDADQNNMAAVQQIAECKVKLKEMREKERKMVSKMFS